MISNDFTCIIFDWAWAAPAVKASAAATMMRLRPVLQMPRNMVISFDPSPTDW
jgi:hypothetical protein